MSAITVRKDADWNDHGWTATPNAIIRDKTLTPDAKWAFSWLASHSSEFRFKAEDLAEAGPKGRNHARDSLRELEEHGWLTRHKVHDPETGRIDGMDYHLHAVPVPVEQRTFVESTAKKRAFPKTRRSDPAPAETGAGEFPPEPTSENPSSDPAPARPGAGRPGAGRPGTGPSVVLYEEEKTTREDQVESEPPLRSGSRAAASGGAAQLAIPALSTADASAAVRQARRARRSPAVLNAEARTGRAVQIVNTYAATCERPPPRKMAIALAREIDDLLGQNWSADDLGEVLALWGTKPLGPGAFQSVAQEWANRKAKPAQRSRTAVAVESTADAFAQLRARRAAGEARALEVRA